MHLALENIAEAESLILGEAYEIHHAYDGDEGLEKARQIKPHVIILDLMLPKRNGYDICFNIRNRVDIGSRDYHYLRWFGKTD